MCRDLTSGCALFNQPLGQFETYLGVDGLRLFYLLQESDVVIFRFAHDLGSDVGAFGTRDRTESGIVPIWE